MHMLYAMAPEEATARARILKALGNPIRLRIVDELSRGERCVCQLQPLFAVDPSTLSRHLTALKAVGIVAERREGARVIHRLATPGILSVVDGSGQVLVSAGRS